MINGAYARTEAFVSRRIGTETVIVPVAEQTAHLGRHPGGHIYALNETAGLAWELFDGRRTLAEIRDTILESYNVDAETLSADLEELVKELLAQSMIRLERPL
ncbi:MAG: PqqD family protein [Planctomycetota bacterium]